MESRTGSPGNSIGKAQIPKQLHIGLNDGEDSNDIR